MIEHVNGSWLRSRCGVHVAAVRTVEQALEFTDTCRHTENTASGLYNSMYTTVRLHQLFLSSWCRGCVFCVCVFPTTVVELNCDVNE